MTQGDLIKYEIGSRIQKEIDYLRSQLNLIQKEDKIYRILFEEKKVSNENIHECDIYHNLLAEKTIGPKKIKEVQINLINDLINYLEKKFIEL